MFVFSILTLLLAIGMIAKGTTVIVAESNYGHFDNFGKIFAEKILHLKFGQFVLIKKLQKDLNNNSPHLGYRIHSK